MTAGWISVRRVVKLSKSFVFDSTHFFVLQPVTRRD